MAHRADRARHVALLILTAFVLAVASLVWPGGKPAFAGEASPLGQVNVPASASWAKANQHGHGLLATASHVNIQAKLLASKKSSSQYTLRVRLQIDNGWHVQANPASLDFLIPTKIAAKAGGQNLTLHTVYPPGVQTGIHLKNTNIKVYQNNTTIQSQLSSTAMDTVTSAGGLHVAVTAQACSDKGICLPPSVMTTHVNYGNG